MMDVLNWKDEKPKGKFSLLSIGPIGPIPTLLRLASPQFKMRGFIRTLPLIKSSKVNSKGEKCLSKAASSNAKHLNNPSRASLLQSQ